MLLYHGTNEASAIRAMKEGLRPRSEHKISHWNHTVPSNSKMVYMTNVYPLYFAANAVKKDDRMAVIEIDADRLQPFNLFPDEDVLEQVNRGRDDLPKTFTMRQRTIHYRKNMVKYSGAFMASLDAMGTCAHFGTIPVNAITRIAFLDFKKMIYLAMNAMDASICLANYKFCKGKYKMMTDWVFSGVCSTEGMDESDKFLIGNIPHILSDMNRSGIEIVDLTK